jgi:hypothetical protein
VPRRVTIKEVIGGDIVLIDGLLDQPQAEDVGIEGEVRGRVCRDRRDVVQTLEVHEMALSSE